MAEYYRLRIHTPSGTPVVTHTVWTLAKTVRALEELTGFEWPYQVIHRALKEEQCYAKAWKRSYVDKLQDEPRYVVTIELDGPPPKG